ncbi:hypothetical protein MAR_002450 [Mya arenaria]|uniref:Uncharacterized protein n=1 Tax=Mya arenaria TaxID=6604 RepID=A0ABY7FG91_MYAAR|nr:hypothetical protein MAR_002450 [Mya arenaria]
MCCFIHQELTASST